MGWFGGNKISVTDAYNAAHNGSVLIDVRTAQERSAEGRPAGATHVPLDKLEGHISKLSGDEVLVICRSGRRSAHAASMLRRHGVSAKNVKGGILAWKRHGLPLDPTSQRMRKKKQR